MSVALKEARETHYWLRMIKHLGMLKPNRFEQIIDEAEQFKKDTRSNCKQDAQ